MRISCPSCSAEYDVPDQALATGPRLLRCARCGHSFRAALPGAPTGEPAPPTGPESRIAALAGSPAEMPARPAQTRPAQVPSAQVTSGPALSGPALSVQAPSGQAATAEPGKAPPTEPTKMPRPPPPPGAAAEDRLGHAPSSPPDRFAMAGWVMTVVALGLAAYASYAFRAEIMAAWPPSQRLYTLLGLV